MPEPIVSLENAALTLAKKSSAPVANPFTAAQYGRWVYDDFGVREGLLSQVLKVWRNEIGDFTDPMPGETPLEALTRPGQLPINHLPEWVRQVCQTYREPPTRTLYYKGEAVGEGHPQEELAESFLKRYDQAAINLTMEKVDALMYLVGNAALVPFFDVDNDELVFHCYPSNQVRVVNNRNNPRRPKATVLVGSDVARDANGMAEQYGVAQAWLPSGEVLYIERGKVVKRETFQGPTPVVHFFETSPDDDYYVHAPGLSLAGMAMVLINHFYDQAGFLTVMQAHSTLVVKGLDPKAKVTVGPGRAMSFPADTSGGESGGETRDAYFIQPNAAISDCIDFLEWAIKRIERTNSIPDAMYEANEASGKARVEAKQPLMEYRKRRFELFRRPETDVLRATMWQLKRANVEGFRDIAPADWDVVATYPAMETPIDVQDRIALEKHDLDNGLRTRGQIIMARNPEKFATPEEAEASVPEKESDDGEPMGFAARKKPKESESDEGLDSDPTE